MPAALKVDKSLVQALYAQGFNSVEISKKTGINSNTVNAWASRYGWARARSLAADMVQQAVTVQSVAVPILSKSVAKSSQTLRSELADCLIKTVPVLRATKPPTSLAGIAQQQEKLAPLVDNARKLFGWDNERVSQSIVSVASLDSAAALESSPAQQAIDLPSTAPQSMLNPPAVPDDQGANPL